MQKYELKAMPVKLYMCHWDFEEIVQAASAARGRDLTEAELRYLQERFDRFGGHARSDLLLRKENPSLFHIQTCKQQTT